MFQTATLLTRPLVAPKYGSLLVPVGVTRESDALVRITAAFANRVGAHLFGVSCADGPRPEDATSVEREAARHLMEAAGQRFEELSAPVRAGRTWRGSDSPLESAIAEFGWAADLVVLDAHLLATGASQGIGLRRLLERTGSPVLTLPAGQAEIKLGRVAVVCDSSHACRRALRCAMPVIARSGAVTLLAADRSVEALRRGLTTRGWGEPRVKLIRQATSAQVADMVAELEPDLAILGGWSEMFGGWPGRSFTDRLLERGDTPLLISA